MGYSRIKKADLRSVWKLSRWGLVTMLFWTGGYLYNRHFDPEVQWIKAIYQQKLTLIEQTQVSQRVLIVGGSGVHFSVDAVQMEADLGRPVFNAGLHAGLGLNAILASVSDEIAPGDVVVLIPEYDLLENDGTGHFSSSFAAAVGRPGLGGFGPKQTAQEMLLAGVPGSDRTVQFLKQQLVSGLSGEADDDANVAADSGGYVRSLDLRGSPQVLPSGEPSPQSVESVMSVESRDRLETFRQKVEDSGGQLVFALPWLLSTDDENSRQMVDLRIRDLAAIAPTIYAEDVNLKTDPTLFGDTVYHLSAHGRSLRSQQLAQALKPYLE